MPRVAAKPKDPEVTHAPSLSMTARPGEAGIATRRIAVLVVEGVDTRPLVMLQDRLRAAGATPVVVAPRIGEVRGAEGASLVATGSYENSAPVLFDAMVIGDGEGCPDRLRAIGPVHEFLVNHYRHGKTILVIGGAGDLLQDDRIPSQLPEGGEDPGLQRVAELTETAIDTFIAAVGRHRHPERETDPPRV